MSTSKNFTPRKHPFVDTELSVHTSILAEVATKFEDFQE